MQSTWKIHFPHLMPTITFNPEHHKYHDERGNEYISVTTLIKEAYPKNMDEIAEKVITLPHSRYFSMTVDACNKLWKAQGDFGTQLHKAIETWILWGTFPPHLSKHYPAVLQFSQGHWRGKLKSEVILHWPELRIAGTADLLEEFDTHFKLWDLKTYAKMTEDKVFQTYTQLGIYAMMIERQYQKPVKIGGILWFPDYYTKQNNPIQIVKEIPYQTEMMDLLAARKMKVMDMI